jgi:hypothetical protein
MTIPTLELNKVARTPLMEAETYHRRMNDGTDETDPRPRRRSRLLGRKLAILTSAAAMLLPQTLAVGVAVRVHGPGGGM